MKILHLNNSNENIGPRGTVLEKVSNCIYLGRKMSYVGYAATVIKYRIVFAASLFNKLM